MNSALSNEALDQVFRQAHTANFYHERPVGESDLRGIWELMKWGPTSANSMPARVVWCLSDTARAKLAACASANNAPRIIAAPAAAIVGMDLEFHEQLPKLYPPADARSWFAGKEQAIRDTAFRNSSLQGAYLIVAARALGFGVGPMSGFDHAKVDEAFFAGTSVRSNFILTLGYADLEHFRPRNPRLGFEEACRVE